MGFLQAKVSSAASNATNENSATRSDGLITRMSIASRWRCFNLSVVRSTVDRALLHTERRFLHRFGERRVRVEATREILDGGRELHRHHRFGDHVGGVGAEDVDAEEAVGLG